MQYVFFFGYMVLLAFRTPCAPNTAIWYARGMRRDLPHAAVWSEAASPSVCRVLAPCARSALSQVHLPARLPLVCAQVARRRRNRIESHGAQQLRSTTSRLELRIGPAWGSHDVFHVFVLLGHAMSALCDAVNVHADCIVQ